jgi:hypothetical protein
MNNLSSTDSAMMGEQSYHYDIDHLYARASSFAPEGFEPSTELRDMMADFPNVLVIGN